MELTVPVSKLTLETLLEGAAEDDFQDALEQMAAAFARSDGGDTSLLLQGGSLNATFTLKVNVKYRPDTGATSITAKSDLALPKRKGRIGQVLRKGDTWYVEKSTEQLTITAAVREAKVSA